MRRTALALVLTTAVLLAALPATAQPQTGQTRLIQVSLLLASKSGPDALDDLPANTRKAVEDIRGFLPFRSYSTLDAGLIRTNQQGRTTLNGPGDKELEISFLFDPGSDSNRLLVRFFRVTELPDLYPRLVPRGQNEGFDTVKPLAPPASRALVATSFEAVIGQTVVVGSSRVNGGDEALIVLFTALP